LYQKTKILHLYSSKQKFFKTRCLRCMQMTNQMRWSYVTTVRRNLLWWESFHQERVMLFFASHFKFELIYIIFYDNLYDNSFIVTRYSNWNENFFNFLILNVFLHLIDVKCFIMNEFSTSMTKCFKIISHFWHITFE
jgi:hypothetical protein